MADAQGYWRSDHGTRLPACRGRALTADVFVSGFNDSGVCYVNSLPESHAELSIIFRSVVAEWHAVTNLTTYHTRQCIPMGRTMHTSACAPGHQHPHPVQRIRCDGQPTDQPASRSCGLRPPCILGWALEFGCTLWAADVQVATHDIRDVRGAGADGSTIRRWRRATANARPSILR
jgi:hypothetical protein